MWVDGVVKRKGSAQARRLHWCLYSPGVTENLQITPPFVCPHVGIRRSGFQPGSQMVRRLLNSQEYQIVSTRVAHQPFPLIRHFSSPSIRNIFLQIQWFCTRQHCIILFSHHLMCLTKQNGGVVKERKERTTLNSGAAMRDIGSLMHAVVDGT